MRLHFSLGRAGFDDFVPPKQLLLIIASSNKASIKANAYLSGVLPLMSSNFTPLS